MKSKEMFWRMLDVGLGVIIDSCFKSEEHLDVIINKALSVLFIIFRTVSFTDHVVLARLYKMYVLPHLEYCSTVWSFQKKIKSN